MIVEEIHIRGATIRVHDDSYVNRTKEEIQSSVDTCSRIIREALIQKRENRVSGRKEGQAWKR